MVISGIPLAFDELELAQLLNRNFGQLSELSLTEASDDSAGLAIECFINDYSSQNDDEDSSESELLEEGIDDDWVRTKKL